MREYIFTKAYVISANPNFNGTSLINASGGNIVVVTFGYRVRPMRAEHAGHVHQNSTNDAPGWSIWFSTLR